VALGCIFPSLAFFTVAKVEVAGRRFELQEKGSIRSHGGVALPALSPGGPRSFIL
jgi:hypothetical protein